MWASIGAAIWGFLQPYIMPILSAFAGETWRRQYDEIIALEKERDQKQAALDIARASDVPISGAAKLLRDSKWNRKQP